jgi:hypothetical protein
LDLPEVNIEENNMRKQWLLGSLTVSVSLLLSGCMHSIDNPFAGYSMNELATVRAADLCRVHTDEMYKVDWNVEQELARRGFKDCSASEIYCRETLSLTPGTEQYTNCRLQRDQFELNKQAIEAQQASVNEMQRHDMAMEAEYAERHHHHDHD